MNTWTIKRRVVVGFVIVLFLVAGLSGTSLLMLGKIRAESEFMDSDAMPGLLAMSKIRSAVSEIQLKVLRVALAKTEQERKQFETEIAGKREEIAKMMNEYASTIHMQEDREMFQTLTDRRDKYIAARGPFFDLINAGKNDEAVAYNAATLRPAYVAYQDIVDKLLKYNIDNTVQSAGRVRTVTDHVRMINIFVSLAVILLGAGLATVIVISVNRVLSRLATSLGESSAQIASAASQVAASSQILAEGATEQAASVEETSASIEELSSITRRNAENAQNVNDLAKKARYAADTNARDIEAMNQAMEAIKTSSDDIAKIIKTIDEIAFQTNILALNAAVEAARAGEAGMGFAVVADEVRSLAQRCAQSARETSGKIEGAIAKTAQGVELSAKFTRGLQEIVGQVRKVDEIAAEVATASNEQSQGIAQVATAVTQIDKVTQSNAGSAEESASAAEEMNAQAVVLKDAIAELLRLTGTQHAVQIADKPHTATVVAKTSASSPAVKRQTRPAQAPVSVPAPVVSNSRGAQKIPMPGDFKDF